MSKKPRKRRIKKEKIKLKSGAKVVRKDSVRNDAIPRMQAPTPMPRSNSAVFKIKMKRK